MLIVCQCFLELVLLKQRHEVYRKYFLPYKEINVVAGQPSSAHFILTNGCAIHLNFYVLFTMIYDQESLFKNLYNNAVDTVAIVIWHVMHASAKSTSYF